VIDLPTRDFTVFSFGWKPPVEPGVMFLPLIDAAQTAAGYGGSIGAKKDKLAITWSRNRLEEYGCFTMEGMEKLRRGGSPEIMEGPHAGDSIALDHDLPKSVVPELAARFYNLEAIPEAVPQNGASV